MAPHARGQRQRARQRATEDGAADADQDRQHHHQRNQDEVVRDVRTDEVDGQAKASRPTDETDGQRAQEAGNQQHQLTPRPAHTTTLTTPDDTWVTGE